MTEAELKTKRCCNGTGDFRPVNSDEPLGPNACFCVGSECSAFRTLDATPSGPAFCGIAGKRGVVEE